MTVRLSVCLRTSAEVPPTDDAGKPATLGGANHFYWFSNFKYVGLQLLTNFKLGKVANAEFLEVGEPAARATLMPGIGCS